ncbi:MAG TPA: HD domain-containing protein [Gemmatimonadaceae bacterium]
MANHRHVLDWTQVKKGDDVTSAFVLIEKNRKSGKNGDFLIIRLVNERGQRLTGKVWSEKLEAFDVYDVGDALMISGKVEPGWPPDENPPPELKVVSFEKIEGPHPVRDAMNPVYDGDIAEIERDLDATIAAIQDPGYRRFAEIVFSGETRARYLKAPAATHNHHNYIGGLAEHTREVKDFALQAADAPGIAPYVNRDLVTLGALVHDLGKLDEYVWEGVPIDKAPRGRLYNHMISGPLRVAELYRAHQMELAELGFTQDDLDHVIHIIASHHGKLEWGANVEPVTIAAQCVHQGDLMSAAIRGMTNTLNELTPDRDGIVRQGRKTIMVDPRSPKARATVEPAQNVSLERVRAAVENAERAAAAVDALTPAVPVQAPSLFPASAIRAR